MEHNSLRNVLQSPVTSTLRGPTPPSTPSASVLPLCKDQLPHQHKTTLFLLSHRQPEPNNSVPVPVPVPTARRFLRLRMEETAYSYGRWQRNTGQAVANSRERAHSSLGIRRRAKNLSQ
jgi:hypothetical protein